ncbi:hypothetical protein [Streptomyces sp. 8N616]|uniref:hypothetical protein n=1 Tax=Streptomyces sp. 8N616 TaxID=3457414 RepID=UPI003FD48E8D
MRGSSGDWAVTGPGGHPWGPHTVELGEEPPCRFVDLEAAELAQDAALGIQPV